MKVNHKRRIKLAHPFSECKRTRITRYSRTPHFYAIQMAIIYGSDKGSSIDEKLQDLLRPKTQGT
jgi:hypothetical protein